MSAASLRLAGGLLLLAASAGAAQAQSRFRYTFSRGECWTYERQVEATQAGRRVHSSRQTLRIWFLDTRVDEADIWVEIAPAGNDAGILYAAPMTIDRLGRRRSPAEIADRLPEIDAALEILPGLSPAMGSAARWESDVDANGRFLRQRLAESAETAETTRVDYEVIDRSGVDAFQGRSAAGEYTWDTAAGRLAQVEERVAFTAQAIQTVTRCKFVEASVVSNGWRLWRIKEVARYLDAVRNETAWLTRAATELVAPARCV